MNIEDVARCAHEVNAAYCRSIGDMSQPGWDAAPQWQRDSAVAGAKFHLENPDAGPSGSHESWLRQKVADGWVWGEVKDPDNKRHPCMVTYDQLPQEQRAKDFLFTAVVKSLESHLDTLTLTQYNRIHPRETVRIETSDVGSLNDVLGKMT
jgi:hypothetical protein